MNRLHRWYCRSDAWAATVRDELPWVLRGVELGDEVLEVGPGPGLTADLLRHRAPRVAAMVLVDPDRFTSRLQAAGFTDAGVRRGNRAFAFRAIRPYKPLGI